MKILFYTPFNQRSRDTESLMKAFVDQGHQVYLLTQSQPGAYHEACAAWGVKVHAHVLKTNPVFFFLGHAFFLTRFCRRHQIDVVYAHLETAGLPAVLAQYFIRAKVFACRHVIDEPYLFGNRNFILLTKIVYRLARQVIVVSARCRDFMISFEKVNPAKIQVIHLAYDFALYQKPAPPEVTMIRNTFGARLLMLTACRLVEPKRAALAIQVTSALRKKNLDVKLLILGDGPQKEALQVLVETLDLSSCVFILGFKSNIIDYLEAADVLIHPSILDSSSVIVKEAGLLAKPIVACRGVGDLEEYIVNGQNGFLVSKENPVGEMEEAVEQIYYDPESGKENGRSLQASVINRFSISQIIYSYDLIHRQLEQHV